MEKPQTLFLFGRAFIELPWSLGVDLNHRLLAYEASVLPLNYPAMALGVGLEPNITGLKGLRTNLYSTRAYCGSAYFAFLYTAFH